MRYAQYIQYSLRELSKIEGFNEAVIGYAHLDEPTHVPPDTFRVSMARYEVKCVTIDYGSQFDDCRCIEEIGFPAEDGVTATRTPAQVYEMVEEEGHTVIVGYRGSEFEVVGATRESTKYVRTEPTDTDEDTLLKQPSC